MDRGGSVSETNDLYQEQTSEAGIIRLAKWPEGYVLWYHGEIVWRSWQTQRLHEWPEFAIAKLELGPNDIVVLRHEGRLPSASIDRLIDLFRTLLPHGNKVVVLEKLDIAVIASTDGGTAA